jgi:hypothetical protein
MVRNQMVRNSGVRNSATDRRVWCSRWAFSCPTQGRHPLQVGGCWLNPRGCPHAQRLLLTVLLLSTQRRAGQLLDRTPKNEELRGRRALAALGGKRRFPGR